MFVAFNTGSYNPYQAQSQSYFNGYVANNQQGQTTVTHETQQIDDGGVVTSQSIGEEGGGDENFQTSEVLNILQHADRGNGFNQQGDGQLSQAELTQFSGVLTQQINMLKAFDQHFPWMGLGSVINNMERQLETARFMGDNYHNIADADGNAQSMTAADVTSTAENDGNADNVSTEDVQDVVTTEAVGEEGGGADSPQQTIDLMRLQQQWDNNRNGQLSRAEVNNASTQLATELEELKQIVNIVFDPQRAAKIEQLTKDLDGMNLMKNNFDALSRADSQIGGNPQQISIFDLLITAVRDGNIFELDPAEIPQFQEPPQFTTLAVGEEGGGAF